MKIKVLVLALMLTGIVAAAQWNNDPAVNTPVCTTATTQQFNSQLAPDGSGGFFVAWQEINADMTAAGIYAQHLSATGTRLWAAEGVDVIGSMGIFSDPQIVSDGNGNTIISWVFNNSGVLRHYVQKISASGLPLWAAGGVLVCPSTVTPLPYYKLISDKNGGAIVVWDDTRAGNNQVYAQRIDADGNLLWPVNGLPTTSNFTALNSYNAVADSTGGVFIGYTLTTNLLYVNEVILQHVMANGSLPWGQVGENLSNVAGDQLYVALTIDSLDNVIATWQDFRLDPQISQIWGQRVNAERELKWGAGGKMLVDSVAPMSTQPKIVTDTIRGAIITWIDDYVADQSGTAHLFGIRIDSTGNVVWEKTELATYTVNQLPGQYELVPDLGSGAYLSWVSSAGSLSAQHVLPNGSTEFTVAGKLVSTALLFLPQLSCDSNGVAVAVWTDLRSGTNYDSYAARISASSTLPVTWVRFSGKLQGKSVLLNWETSNEINNKGFTIQRSSNGLRFDSIGFVASSTQYHYEFTDHHPVQGSNFYRLRQKDIDGNISNSRTIRVDVDTNPAINIYPNPTAEWITVRGLSSGSLISIYGVDGKKYKDVKSTGSIVQINVSKFFEGIYYIKIQQHGIATSSYQSMFLKRR